jgi:hypothetical protein
MTEALAEREFIDRLEQSMSGMTPREMPVTHRFTPGLYIREIHIPAGTLLTSMEHKTRHPFVVSKGRIAVMSENEGRVVYQAPFTGITEPGTRRALFAETDTIWTTFHATDKTSVEEIAGDILEPHQNPLLGADHPALNQWRRELPTIEKS